MPEFSGQTPQQEKAAREQREFKRKRALFRLPMQIAKRGVEILSLTPNESLELAIEARETAKRVGPFDIAHSKFVQDALDYENLATMLEDAQPFSETEKAELLSRAKTMRAIL